MMYLVAIECIKNMQGSIPNKYFSNRLGTVPVCEASVIIAISSEHRAESLSAVQHTINALKAMVPIWKKEVYDEASSSQPEWKSNKECAWSTNNNPPLLD
jgi:molybdopterin synthase catalytic subunit